MIYFNVEPGIYTLIVETQENHWIDVTTLPVGKDLTHLSKQAVS